MRKSFLQRPFRAKILTCFSVFQFLSTDFSDTLWIQRKVKKSSNSAVRAPEPANNFISWTKCQKLAKIRPFRHYFGPKFWLFFCFPVFCPQISLTLCGSKEQSKRGRTVQYELQNLPKTQFHEQSVQNWAKIGLLGTVLGQNFDFFLFFLFFPLYFPENFWNQRTVTKTSNSAVFGSRTAKKINSWKKCLKLGLNRSF